MIDSVSITDAPDPRTATMLELSVSDGPNAREILENTMKVTRRAALSRAIAIVGSSAAGSLLRPESARAADDPAAKARMQNFLGVSEILTGISQIRLSPQRDPIDIKTTYLTLVTNRRPVVFERLLQKYGESRAISPDPKMIGAKLLDPSEPKVCYLARSIMLMWYLGVWYEPEDLQLAESTGSSPNFSVISPAAYTQAWVWRVAQAHPMGYSEWHFGYWHEDPPFKLENAILPEGTP